MKHTILTTLVLTFFTGSLFSQTFQKQWHFKGGGVKKDIIYDIIKDTADNVYVTGRFTGTVDFDPSSGVYNLSTPFGYTKSDVFLQKLDANGNLLWAKSFGGTVDSYEYGRNLALDDSGNVYLSGVYNLNIRFKAGGTLWDAGTSNLAQNFLVKLDPLGNVIWDYGWSAMGTGDFLFIRDILCHPNGKKYLTGNFNGTMDFDPSTGVDSITATAYGSDIFIMRLSESGALEKVRTIADNSGLNIGYQIKLDNQGGLILTGAFSGTIDFDNGTGVVNKSSFNNATDAFITEIDTGLNYQWVETFGNSGSDEIIATRITPMGDIYNIGLFSGTVDFNLDAGIFNLTSSAGFSLFIQKLNSSGNFIWAKKVDGWVNSDYSHIDLALSDLGDIGFVANFKNTIYIDPSSANYSLTSNGGYDAFVIKLDSNGTFITAANFGSTSDDFTRSICFVNNQELLVGGEYSGTMDIDPTTGVSNITSAGQNDFFMLKLSSCSFTYVTYADTACGSYTMPSGNATYTTSGTYSDTLSSLQGCDSILTINLTVLPDLNPTVIQTIYGLEASVIGAVNYQWLDCSNNQVITGATDSVFMPSYNGDYAVIVDNGNCADTSACFTINNIGIKETVLNSISIYPNPTNGILIIKSSIEINLIEVYDLTGRKVLKGKGNLNSVDLAVLTTGVYLVKVSTEEGVVVRRVVKK